ncbi:MAG TPA: YicC/YloC family endoribonuclease [Thermoanaerobaculia bacterium]|nr:YicC/YloC family endoribonuclease [Thermoanaerobaculia bacterium]
MSLRSMTGFGRASGPVGEGLGEVWARSVNHRSLDLTIRVKDTESALEPILRRVFSRKLSRGKVDVNLRLKRAGAADFEIAINEALLESVLSRLENLASRFPVAAKLEARDLLSIPQVFAIEAGSAEFTPEEIASVEGLAERAASELVAMRELEGAGLAQDILSRIGGLRTRASGLSARREEITRALLAALRERIQTLLSNAPLDPVRLEQEAALAADRSDVAEELQRLEAHLTQFAELVRDSSQPVGKKLDFLSQEILRELNTLGSKARDLALVREVLEMKSETEKVREQIGNIE